MLRLGENPCGGILWLKENMKLSYFPQFPQFHEYLPGKTLLDDLDDEFLAPVPIEYHRLVKTVTCGLDCAVILDMLMSILYFLFILGIIQTESKFQSNRQAFHIPPLPLIVFNSEKRIRFTTNCTCNELLVRNLLAFCEQLH